MSGEVGKPKQKLSYEALEAYANQTTMQAQRIFKENEELVNENKKLREVIDEMRHQANYAEINLAFKVLDHADYFDEEFVRQTAKRLQEALTPVEKEVEEPKPEPENKE